MLVHCTLLAFIFLYGQALSQSSKEGDWQAVPLQGKISVERSMDFETFFGGAGLVKKESASMTIIVDDTVRVKRDGSTQLFTEGKVVTTVQGSEIWDFGDQGSFTHTYRLSGKEPFGSDPKLTKQRVYLEVNANRYPRLKPGSLKPLQLHWKLT